MTLPEYIKDGPAITAASFEIVAREVDLSGFPPDIAPLVARVVHACGMPDVVSDIRFDPAVARAAAQALNAGAPILCDAAMVAAGVTPGRMPAHNAVLCPLRDRAAEVAARAAERRMTRSAAAVDLWELDGAVAAIGVAPTALFRLLERMDAGEGKPAAILAFPVGFVGAAESKAALAADSRGVPFFTLAGRRGGAGMAAAAVNAAAKPTP